MKHLSRKKSIELCIKLWTWLAKTGKSKKEWPKWDKWKNYYGGNIKNNCWFCYYGEQQRLRYGASSLSCNYCPLYKRVKVHCMDDKNPFWIWFYKAKTKQRRKKYAKLFLKQIKEIK